MLRLRTTTSLSLLVLSMGVAGTAWLSDQTGGRDDPKVQTSHHVAMHRVLAAHVVHRAHESVKRRFAATTPHHASLAVAAAVSDVVRHPESIAWIPVSMPMSTIPFARARDHSIGNVVLHLVVNEQGQVTGATLIQSSGDAILDANAVAMAEHWRFAVPADHPRGFSGDLPLSFTTASAQLAQTP
jgi:protein TonB